MPRECGGGGRTGGSGQQCCRKWRHLAFRSAALKWRSATKCSLPRRAAAAVGVAGLRRAVPGTHAGTRPAPRPPARRGLAGADEEGSCGRERLESAQAPPRKRRPEFARRGARRQRRGVLPAQQPGTGALVTACVRAGGRAGSRESLCLVVVVVAEHEHRAEGRALRQHAHTAGARRQRAKDPLWA